ncbi:MAG: hypothetical protein ACK521_03090 [bacterium]
MMILTSKSELELEYEQFNVKKETDVDPEVLKSLVLTMREFLEGSELPDDIIALALKKNNLDLEQAIVMVVDETTVAELAAELEREQEERIA